jgi:alpha-N-arabinofuranosidase
VQEMAEWIEYMTFDGVSPLADLRRKNGREKPWRVDYFGVGNENWGCGGNMTPEYYANLYRRYQTFVKQYNVDAPIYKICCGANVDDYHWTEKVMAAAHDHTEAKFHGHMDGISLHYYVHPGGWDNKGSATRFDEAEWFRTMYKAMFIEQLVEGHGRIMDIFDPERKIDLIVDEWGCWFDVEPGTNPGFLYQQNTMRDALVACISLNIFNKHCRRIKMANIAQVVNVLQAMVLTEGGKMLLTPTYYIFRMYKHHQNGQLLDSFAETTEIGTDDYKVPDISESVSMDEKGNIHITLGNLSITEEKDLEILFFAKKAEKARATILTGAMDSYNTFENPENIKEEEYHAFSVMENGTINVILPPCSVVHIEVEA